MHVKQLGAGAILPFVFTGGIYVQVALRKRRKRHTYRSIQKIEESLGVLRGAQYNRNVYTVYVLPLYSCKAVLQQRIYCQNNKLQREGALPNYESMSKQELIDLLLLKEKPLCNKPCDAFEYVRKYGKKKQEYLIVVFVDGAGQMYGKKIVSVGTVNNTIVHPREVFAPAIAKRAASIVIAHNHPSGVLTPSAEDLQVTNSIVSAGRILGIPVRDHIIFSDVNYYSMHEHGDVYFNV